MEKILLLKVRTKAPQFPMYVFFPERRQTGTLRFDLPILEEVQHIPNLSDCVKGRDLADIIVWIYRCRCGGCCWSGGRRGDGTRGTGVRAGFRSWGNTILELEDNVCLSSNLQYFIENYTEWFFVFITYRRDTECLQRRPHLGKSSQWICTWET